MPLPTSIIEMLDIKNVSYNVTDMSTKGGSTLELVPNDNAGCVVKSLLVQDAQGRAQVLIPANHLLDLDAMFRNFGRNFEGVPGTEMRPLFAEHRLTAMPALPSWQGMPTFVDQSLLKKEKLWLDSGNVNQLVELTQNDFSSMIESATVGNITVPAPGFSNSSADDEKQIINSVERFTQLRIKQRLDETLEMPPLPETAQRIIKLRADPNADISDLTNIVEIDPSLAAQVVSWAASPYYSAPGKIKSVHDAIVRVLGFDMVLNLALGLALGKSLSMENVKREQVDKYWQSAVYTAATVEGLVTSIVREHRPSFGMAYLSGLLHNFGYLVLAEIFPPYFHNISRMATANPHVPRELAEKYLIGISGNQLSAWLLENWNMPDEVVVALRHQNNLSYEEDNDVYAKLIYIAQTMLANHGFGNSLGGTIPDSLFESLHLDPETAHITVENILDSGEDLDAIADKMRG